MAAQSFLYHQVRRASQSATSHFSPEKKGGNLFLFALFPSSYSVFTLERAKYSGRKFRFLVIHQDPIRRIPYSIPRAGQSLPFRWLNNIASEKKGKNLLKKLRSNKKKSCLADGARYQKTWESDATLDPGLDGSKIKSSERNVDGWKKRKSILIIGWIDTLFF